MSDAQGIVTEGGDATAAPGAATPRVEPDGGADAPRYTVHPAHDGIVNRYIILRNLDRHIVGRSPSESDAIAACRLMNEMAGKK